VKNRNIPYGYSYENGGIVVNSQESSIVLEIFHSYISGKSFGYLSKLLSERKIEFTDGVVEWNKARIKRIVEDERYLGEKGFPQLISMEIYTKIKSLQEEKNTKKDINPKADIYQLDIPVRCPKCNGVMFRKYERLCKRKERWQCKTEGCGTTIFKKDDELLDAIIELLKMIKNATIIIQIQEQPQQAESVELRTLKNEIVQRLDKIDVDGKKVRGLMIEYASRKYAELSSNKSVTQRLRDVFKETTIDEQFPLELLNSTVKEIVFDEDGSIGIVLINNQKIKKEI